MGGLEKAPRSVEPFAFAWMGVSGPRRKYRPAAGRVVGTRAHALLLVSPSIALVVLAAGRSLWIGLSSLYSIGCPLSCL